MQVLLQLATLVQRAREIDLCGTHGVARDPLAEHLHELRALLRGRKPAEAARQPVRSASSSDAEYFSSWSRNIRTSAISRPSSSCTKPSFCAEDSRSSEKWQGSPRKPPRGYACGI